MNGSPLPGIIAVFGGFLIHFTLGTTYTFGNMNPYITSYMRARSKSTEVTYTQAAWIFSLSVAGLGLSMPVGGLLQRRLGSRLTVLLGCAIMSSGVLLTSLTCSYQFGLVLLTYGLMTGIGTGLAYAVAIACCMDWFPSRRGLIGGCVVAGFGGGSLVFNQVQTAFINPLNLQPNSTVAGESYFDEEQLLDRVPQVFLLLGGCYAALQLIGCLLLRSPQVTVNLAEDNSEDDLVTASSQLADDDGQSAWLPKALLSSEFWFLWATFFANTQALVYLSTQYKSVGLANHLEDRLLAIVGSVAAVFNASARIFWGWLFDRFRYTVPMLVLCCCMAAAAPLLVPVSSQPVLFTICVCFMFSLIAGNFALLPAACSATWGKQLMPINFGLLGTANASSSILAPILTSLIVTRFGWEGVFIMAAGFAGAGAVLTTILGVVSRRGSHAAQLAFSCCSGEMIP